MMAALEEVVRLRGEKEAKVASLKAEAEELRARTAAEAGRRDRAKLKAAEILAPVPALNLFRKLQWGSRGKFKTVQAF